MAGVLPARVKMTKTIQALEYVNGSYTGQHGLWAGSVSLRAMNSITPG
ncbi:MAG: hypothetical protein WCF90_05735 [Methanomicrobiales archaeon]